MDDETKAKIAEIFAKHERSLARHRQVVPQREPAEQAFVDQYEELRASVIDPTLRSIGDEVAGRGYVYRIEHVDEQRFADGRGTNARTTIFFSRKIGSGHHSGEAGPHFVVSCETPSKRIGFFQSTSWPWSGGTSSGVGSCEIRDLTPPLIEKKLLGFLAEIFL